MEVTAKLRQLRIAPRKVRVVVDQVRGMKVEQAEAHLKTVTKRAAVPVLKLIQSAAANAEHNHNLSKSDLVIKQIMVDDGITLKRWKPRAMGRATPIRKRSSHVTVIVDVAADAKQAAQAKANAKTDEKAEKKKTAKKEEGKAEKSAEEKKPAAKKKAPAKKKPAAKKEEKVEEKAEEKKAEKKPAAKKKTTKKA